MTGTLIGFAIIAVFAFLAATAMIHFLSRSGFGWLVVCLIAGVAIFAGYLFSSKGTGAPEDKDFLRFILSWVLVVPALSGAVLGGLVGGLKRMRGNR